MILAAVWAPAAAAASVGGFLAVCNRLSAWPPAPILGTAAICVGLGFLVGASSGAWTGANPRRKFVAGLLAIPLLPVTAGVAYIAGSGIAGALGASFGALGVATGLAIGWILAAGLLFLAPEWLAWRLSATPIRDSRQR